MGKITLKDLVIGDETHELTIKNENGTVFLIFDDYDFVINIEDTGITMERRCGKGDDDWEVLSKVDDDWSQDDEALRIEFGARPDPAQSYWVPWSTERPLQT